MRVTSILLSLLEILFCSLCSLPSCLFPSRQLTPWSLFPSSLLTLFPVPPCRLQPDGSRGGSTVPGEEKMKKDISIIPSFFPLSFKEGSRCPPTHAPHCAHTAPRSRLRGTSYPPVGCRNRQTSVRRCSSRRPTAKAH